MLNKKEVAILKLLFTNRHQYLTSQEIASELKISDRTARKYIHSLDEGLADYQASIIAKQGNGYRLSIMNQTLFDQFYKQQEACRSLKPSLESIQEAKDRQHFILSRFFFDQECIEMDHLLEELYVSQSTLSNDLLEIKKELANYQLTIKGKAGKGFCLVGNEQNKRHFIMKYFFMDRLQDNLHAFSSYTTLLDTISIEEILIIVLDECRESHLKLSDIIMYNIVLHIALAIKRLQSGFELDFEMPDLSLEGTLEYQTSKKIIERVSNNLEMGFPKEEVMNVALHLLNKTSSLKVFQRGNFSQAEIKEQLLDTLMQMDQDLSLKLSADNILIDGLMAHFVPLLMRLQNKSPMDNPLLNEIKANYQHVLDLTQTYIAKMPIFEEYCVSESEWAYVAIHLMAALERFINTQKLRVLAICATGLGSSQMIKIRLEHELGSKLVIKHVISYYEIRDQELEDVDLIVSSIDLPNMVFNIPVVYVSVFLNQEDIRKINSEIAKHKGLENLKITQHKLSMKEPGTDLTGFFKPDLFMYCENLTTKEQVLYELSQRVSVLECGNLTNQLVTQFKLREQFSSVAFSQRLAIPHPVEALTQQAHVAIAVIPQGIKWDQDHTAIQLVMLLLPDRLNHQHMEQVSQAILPLIEEDSLIDDLINCQTFEAFMEAFQRLLVKDI